MPQKPTLTYVAPGASGYDGQARVARSGQSHTGRMPTCSSNQRTNSAVRSTGTSMSWITRSRAGLPRARSMRAITPNRFSSPTSR